VLVIKRTLGIFLRRYSIRSSEGAAFETEVTSLPLAVVSLPFFRGVAFEPPPLLIRSTPLGTMLTSTQLKLLCLTY
jgi:hypothetical protein